MSILDVALDPSTVVVAVDPGKVMNRVWVSNGLGLLEDPVSLPVARAGIERLEAMLAAHPSPARVIAIEATGWLHRAWAAELELRHPGALRLFAPSETKAARTQLGSGRFKTDDRDCAALTYLARQGAGRCQGKKRPSSGCGPRCGTAAGLVGDRKVAQQRLHDQLNALCPGLSAPGGHGSWAGRADRDPDRAGGARVRSLRSPGAPTVRSLIARAPGKFTKATAEYWVTRWRGCLRPPSDAEQRAARLGRTWPATALCRSTSPPWSTRSRNCWPAATDRC